MGGVARGLRRGLDAFAGTAALTRGQGVASDGTSWFFSGTVSLERTDLAFARQQVSNFAIPQALQTKGVPWVAINGPASQAIFAEWDPTTQLNLFSLPSVTLAGSLPLPPAPGVMIGRIQGGKIHEGALYLASDDATKSLFKVNLETGTVLRLFSIATTGEQEGLAFLSRPDGTALHTLNVNASSSGSELRHHERPRLPVRKSVCP